MATLQDLIAQALDPNSPGGASVTPEEGQDVLSRGMMLGASAEDLSAISGIPVSEINAYIQANGLRGNLAQAGSAEDTYTPTANNPPVNTPAAQPPPVTQQTPQPTAQPTSQPIYAQTNQQVGFGSGAQQQPQTQNPGYIQGAGGGGGGSPNASPAEWAQIAQSNADYLNAVQNSIFNNPNITLADGSRQTTTFGNMPDYAAYVQNNPDLLADFQGPNNPFPDIESYGRWHWQNQGNAEGRQMPLASPSDLGLLQPEVNVNLSPEEQAIYDTNQRSRSALAAMGEQQLGRINQSFNSPTVQGNLYDPSGALSTEGLFNFSQDPSQYLPDTGYNFSPTQQDLQSYSQYQTQPGIQGYTDIRNDLVAREKERFDQARNDLKSQLMVQGLDPESESFKRQMDNLNRAENDFYLGTAGQAAGIQNSLFNMENQAKNTQLGAQGTFAGIEQSQKGQQADIGQGLFNMEGQRRQQDFSERTMAYDYGKDWRNTQIQEDAYFRNQPLNEYNALTTGTQIGLPQFTGYTGFQTQAPDFAGAEQETYNRSLYDQQRSDNNRNALFQGLGSIAGTALGGYASGGGFSGGLISGARGLFG